jgi:hypothetical protein
VHKALQNGVQDATGSLPKAPEVTDVRMSKALRGSGSIAGNKHATVAVHVPVVTVLFFAHRTGSNDDARAAPWVKSVLDAPNDPQWSPQAHDAALWANKIAPILDVNVIDLRYMSPKGTLCC